MTPMTLFHDAVGVYLLTLIVVCLIGIAIEWWHFKP